MNNKKEKKKTNSNIWGELMVFFVLTLKHQKLIWSMSETVLSWVGLSFPFHSIYRYCRKCVCMLKCGAKTEKKCEYIFFCSTLTQNEMKFIVCVFEMAFEQIKKKKKKCGKMVPLRAYKKFIPDSDVSIKACSMFTHAQTSARTQQKVDSNNRLSFTKEIKEECAVPFGESK